MAQGKARLEDRRMITGSGRYAADWNLPGQAHAHFVRAERAHAEILSIDLAAARALPGVLLVLRGEDLAAAGFGSLPANLAFSGVGGMTLRRPPRPVLALGRV
ncbi:MAG: xanthine dehydrogenase family protein molybdopterin-binding subunit, partial [Burkholderiales bacterium]|nr:xanthine dehydrogenase family protein molybdopterin-binding subunit [Burkholderiales bacterium]